MAKVPRHVLDWKNRVADVLLDRGYETQSTNLHKCSQTELLLCCESCGHSKYVVYHCGNRICPVCSWKVSRDRARYSEAMLQNMQYPKFITLTMPTWTRDPRDGIKFLRAAFTKLRGQKIWRPVVGGCYQIELKSKENGWHIHLHILMDAPYMPKEKIFSAWKKILGLDFVSIRVKACRTKAQRAYVVKYVSKNDDFHNDAEAAADWYEATKGTRLFGTFGTWYNAKIEELLNLDEKDVWKPACENCGDPDHMFFARDGPFIFGKEWLEVCGTFVGDNPTERVIEAEYEAGAFAFLEALVSPKKDKFDELF